MDCPKCGYPNPTTMVYCKRCGVKIKYTYEEVHFTLSEQAKKEREEATEQEMRKFLIVALFLFLLAFTWKVLFWKLPRSYAVPGISSGEVLLYTQAPAFIEPLELPVPE